jgi:hypothetical protein
MSEEEIGESTTADEVEVEVTAERPRGMELDFRPHPALFAGDTQNFDPDTLNRIRKSENASDLEPARDPNVIWPDGNITGAFISSAASLRHEVTPYSWWDTFKWGILLIIVTFVLPVGLIAFAVWKMMQLN